MSIFYKNCLKSVIGINILLISGLVFANPEGGNPVFGDVKIETTGTTTTVTQNSSTAGIDWQSFNIAPNETVKFNQPNDQAVILNRVVGEANPSHILGRIQANGQVFLLNPAGIVFGAGSSVDVAGLVATTGKIDNNDFIAGKYNFKQSDQPNAGITNQGHIRARENGFVCLAGSTVYNSGAIEAKLGKVVLAATPLNSAYTVDFHGDQLIQFTLPAEESKALDKAIIQNGKISAPGGKIVLAAGSAKNVVDKAININGIIEADTISNIKGTIVLSAGETGTAEVTGKLQAAGKSTDESGGSVTITGKNIGLLKNANIDVAGQAGGGKIKLASTNAIYAHPEAKLNASATDNGNGGSIIMKSDKILGFHGSAEATGGTLGGNGGFIETSSKNSFSTAKAKINTSASKGKPGQWLIDPYDIHISKSSPTTADYSNHIYTASIDNANIYIDDLLNNLKSSNIKIITQKGGGTQPGDIYLDSDLKYTENIDTTLTLESVNDIILDGAVSGAKLRLVLDAMGSANIKKDINNIGSLLVKENGITNINTNNITTQSFQYYNNPVNINTDVSFNAINGNIDFDKDLTASIPYDLSLTANSIEALDDIGTLSNPLGGLVIKIKNHSLYTEEVYLQNVFASSIDIQIFNFFKSNVLKAETISIEAGKFTADVYTGALTLNIKASPDASYLAIFDGAINGKTTGLDADITFISGSEPSQPGQFYFNNDDLYKSANQVLVPQPASNKAISEEDSSNDLLSYKLASGVYKPNFPAISDNAKAVQLVAPQVCGG